MTQHESEQLDDIATLSRSALLSPMTTEHIGVLLELVRVQETATGDVVRPRGLSLGVVLAGKLQVERPGTSAREIGVGDHLGEIGFACLNDVGEAAHASTDARVGWVDREAFAHLQAQRPDVASSFLGALAALLADDLARTKTAAPLLSESLRPGPRRAAEVLPAQVDGALVVAARLGDRALSLSSPIPSESAVLPITTRTGEGREVFRRSAGLALLEAARRVGDQLTLGPSISSGRIVELGDLSARTELLARLSPALEAVIAEDLPLVEEIWDVERALSHFEERGWRHAAALLATWGEPTVELIRCGEVRALGPGPVLPSTGLLSDVALLAHPQGLLLDFGGRVRDALARRPYSTIIMERVAPRYGAAMTRSQGDWLRKLGITSMGDFNAACISGGVKELVFVSEGFHEKHIAQIADEIRSRAGLRIVAVAGPSSSGKTTFIKRLTVQLSVNGIRTLGLSLDDYYLERARVPLDASGERDFEVIDALDRQQLESDVERLLNGESVPRGRYDFRTGTPAQGGPPLSLAADQILLVEGIHALNPQLLPDAARGCVFRIFIHPATTLPFDALSLLEPGDVRLLRRIVRDRHQRGFATDDTLTRWPSVRRGERLSIFPFQGNADCVFDSSLIYEPSVLKVYAERYLQEVRRSHPEHPAAHRLRRLLGMFVPIHPECVPPTSILREFIGGSGFAY